MSLRISQACDLEQDDAVADFRVSRLRCYTVIWDVTHLPVLRF
jgi:hypothetical protein